MHTQLKLLSTSWIPSDPFVAACSQNSNNKAKLRILRTRLLNFEIWKLSSLQFLIFDSFPPQNTSTTRLVVTIVAFLFCLVGLMPQETLYFLSPVSSVAFILNS